MIKKKKVSIIAAIVLIVIISIFGIYDWIEERQITGSTIIFLCIGIGILFEALASEGEIERTKDEKNRELKSARISYYIVIILMLIILIASEGFKRLSDMSNKPLIIAIGLAYISLPITEFVMKVRIKA